MDKEQNYIKNIEPQSEMTEAQEAILGIIGLLVALLIGLAIGYFIGKRQK